MGRRARPERNYFGACTVSRRVQVASTGAEQRGGVPTLATHHTGTEDEGLRHEPTSGYEDPNLNYRVTWKDASGETQERIFTSRHQGWDFYEDMRARDAT